MSDVADVVVIGGGCIGSSIAWQLARRGAGKVVLIEKRGIASGATGWSSAIVRMHYTLEPLARMALFGRRMFERFDEVVGGECGFRRTGFLVLLNEQDRGPAAAIVEMQRRIGIDARMLSPREVSEIEPRLSRADVVAGAWEPDSGHADGSSTANSFAAAARREGAEIRIGPVVTRVAAGDGGVAAVETDRGPVATRCAVVAAGFRTSALLRPLGADLPIRPIRHTIAVVERTPGFGKPHPVVSDRPQLGYYRPEGERLTLVGAHDPLEGDEDPEVEIDRAAEARAMTRLTTRFWKRFPGQDTAILRRGYTGVYDCTPDFQPALGPVAAVPGLYVAAGFSGHGFKLSPAVGALIAEAILTGKTGLADISMFRVERFAEGKLITRPGGYASRSLA